MSQTILLIDDDASLLNLLGKYLEKASYHVLRADGGLAGVKALFEHHPDLVVLDVMMPHGWLGNLPPHLRGKRCARYHAHRSRRRIE
jgi:DNA-binding response OmpR family regulator